VIYGKTMNEISGPSRRSKITQLFVGHGELDPNRSRHIDTILAKRRYRKPDLSVLESKPEGGTRVEVKRA
jgi:hypothetical protein